MDRAWSETKSAKRILDHLVLKLVGDIAIYHMMGLSNGNEVRCVQRPSHTLVIFP